MVVGGLSGADFFALVFILLSELCDRCTLTRIRARIAGDVERCGSLV